MEILTQRLLLTPPEEHEAEIISTILNHPLYAENTLNIPFPYTKEHALFWINLAKEGLKNRNQFIFAIKLKEDQTIIGGIDLGIDNRNNKAEIGYWIDQNFNNQGFATEACRAMIEFGFKDLKLKRIFATHFESNAASGKVLSKSGMFEEGLLKAYTRKNNVYQNHILYSIINDEV